jgi:large subunit ribosomal protein L5
MNALYESYKKEIAPKLASELGIKNVMATPRMKKIVINCGLGEATGDKKVLEKVASQLAVIAGQKPAITRAKRAISSFKLRAGDAIGLKATLRGERMYDFFAKLVRIALPRVRDFRGAPLRGFDGNGNYTMGISEQTIFPELPYNLVDKTRGFEITFVTSAQNDEQAKALLGALGMPFEKES